jgi:hypothetical protein
LRRDRLTGSRETLDAGDEVGIDRPEDDDHVAYPGGEEYALTTPFTSRMLP